jgi:serine/threonine-protein kinase
MATPSQVIERALSGPFSTSGSFEDERLRLLWERCRLLFISGLVIASIALILNVLFPQQSLELGSTLDGYRWLTGALAHTISFAIALGLLYSVCRSSYRFLHTIAFGTIAFNILLVIYNQGAFNPAGQPDLGVSLLLFLTAAFVPWRPSHQWSLAALAAVFYLLLHGTLYSALPEYQAFWAKLGGADAARDNMIWGLIGIAMLGGASAFVSHTLYNLTKTAHRARRLGKYIIHDEIGKGGMGVVYFAQHALMCRPTAVKVMTAAEDGSHTALARFEREVKLSATLTHPNTITIYDVGRTPDYGLYYAMEYLLGLDLQKLVDTYGPVSPARTIYILRQVCGSLSEAHDRNIIHRDIKPSNIFLTRRGGLYDFVKVLDFGLAKQIGADTAAAVTKTGILFGTPRFLAPETVYGTEQVDGRADLYCLGGVAYWMLAGRPPFVSESSLEVVVDHVKTAPKPLSEVTETAVPPALEEIVMKCLEKKPGDRFQTARQMRLALEAVPVANAWNSDRAEEWWDLHGIVESQAQDDQCMFPEPEIRPEEETPLSASNPSASPLGPSI